MLENTLTLLLLLLGGGGITTSGGSSSSDGGSGGGRASVGEEVTDVLALECLGEEAGPVGLDLHTGSLADGVDLVGLLGRVRRSGLDAGHRDDFSRRRQRQAARTRFASARAKLGVHQRWRRLTLAELLVLVAK